MAAEGPVSVSAQSNDQPDLNDFCDVDPPELRDLCITKNTIVMTWDELEACQDLERRLPGRKKKNRPGTSAAAGGSGPDPRNSTIDENRSSSAISQNGEGVVTGGRGGGGNKNKQQALSTVKILRRQPNSDPCLSSVGSDSSGGKPPIKTLEEREAAYAEARARILGQPNCVTTISGTTTSATTTSATTISMAVITSMATTTSTTTTTSSPSSSSTCGAAQQPTIVINGNHNATDRKSLTSSKQSTVVSGQSPALRRAATTPRFNHNNYQPSTGRNGVAGGHQEGVTTSPAPHRYSLSTAEARLNNPRGGSNSVQLTNCGAWLSDGGPTPCANPRLPQDCCGPSIPRYATTCPPCAPYPPGSVGSGNYPGSGRFNMPAGPRGCTVYTGHDFSQGQRFAGVYPTHIPPSRYTGGPACITYTGGPQYTVPPGTVMYPPGSIDTSLVPRNYILFMGDPRHAQMSYNCTWVAPSPPHPPPSTPSFIRNATHLTHHAPTTTNPPPTPPSVPPPNPLPPHSQTVSSTMPPAAAMPWAASATQGVTAIRGVAVSDIQITNEERTTTLNSSNTDSAPT